MVQRNRSAKVDSRIGNTDGGEIYIRSLATLTPLLGPATDLRTAFTFSRHGGCLCGQIQRYSFGCKILKARLYGRLIYWQKNCPASGKVVLSFLGRLGSFSDDLGPKPPVFALNLTKFVYCFEVVLLIAKGLGGHFERN
jgi:hypothetical protein